MAALTKSRPAQLDDNRITLSSSIPTPFSSTDRDYILHSSHTNGLHHAITPSPIAYEHPPLAQESQVDGEVLLNADRVSPAIQVSSLCYLRPKSHMDTSIQDQHLMPSIARVQASVLSTLSNLLSPFYPQQHPGILDHAHSVLTQPSSSLAVPSTPSHSPTTALRNLVVNLRHDEFRNSEMIQVSSSDDDTALLRELFGYVDALTPSLHAQDAQLVHALVSLLADLNRLSVLGVSPPSKDVPVWSHDASIPNSGNLDSLARQLSEFQLQRHDQSDQEGSLPPVIAVEKALLWVRIDEALETVLNLCHYREEDSRHSLSDPPQYDLLSHDGELPPNYDPDPELFGSDTKTLASLSYRMSIDEKMRLDLDEVTTAIDRLYRVAPQLHNQRVELKRSKLKELEIARAAQAGPASLGKQKERELERIVDMIGRASERKLVQQTVILGDMDARIERMRQRDLQKVHFN
jgi:ubiquitin-protein ligase E3 D